MSRNMKLHQIHKKLKYLCVSKCLMLIYALVELKLVLVHEWSHDIGILSVKFYSFFQALEWKKDEYLMLFFRSLISR